METLRILRRLVDRRLGEFDAVRRQYREELESVDRWADVLETVLEAQEFSQQVAQEIQQQAHNKIAGVVSRCLEAVFDEPYQFQILFERKRGRTEARLVFERDGLEVDPMTASGGGVIDVAAFALRLSCLLLQKPPLRKVLILDEPFKFVSEEYRSRVKLLLETLAEEMGVQFVMVTHIDELKTGKVVEL